MHIETKHSATLRTALEMAVTQWAKDARDSHLAGLPRVGAQFERQAREAVEILDQLDA